MNNKDPIKSMGDSGAPEIYAIPVPLVMPTMLLNIMTKGSRRDCATAVQTEPRVICEINSASQ